MKVEPGILLSWDFECFRAPSVMIKIDSRNDHVMFFDVVRGWQPNDFAFCVASLRDGRGVVASYLINPSWIGWVPTTFEGGYDITVDV
jgi:hypothetical protein